jgi:hypothetical protein
MAIPRDFIDSTSLIGPFERVRDRLQAYADAGVTTPETVAGRDAYILSLRPRSDDTLVGSIEVAIDAETRLPLRLQIVPRNALDPSIEIGFSTIDFDPIDPSMFVFDPPAEATVTDAGPALGRILDEATTGGHVRREALREVRDALPAMRVYGKGFGLVVAVRLSEVPRELRAMLPYSGPLASAALVDRQNGAWLVAGAVTPDALSAVQSRLP